MWPFGRRRRSADDFGEEIRSHLDLEQERLAREGLSPTEAVVAAHRAFGNVTSARERFHLSRRIEWLDRIGQDLRYAARGLRREPLFTAFVVMTLALGIGANAAMFGVVDRLLLRGPEHIVNPERVMRFYATSRPAGMNESTTQTFGYVMYELLRKGSHSFDGVAAYRANPESKITFGHGADAQQVGLGQATADLFPMLGVRPTLGRFFTAQEDRTSRAEHVTVIGYGLWQRMYGGDRGVIGRTVTLGDAPYTIVGVTPKGFTGPQFARVDVWVPMSLHLTMTTPDDFTRTWNARWLEIIGRLKPGVTTEQASADATLAFRHAYDGGSKTDSAARLFVAPMSFDNRGKESTEVTVSRWLVGVAVVVLCIACSNVVNLLLARAVRRRREMAVRLALGARRSRLVRLLLTESLMLAALGGFAALVVAWLAGQLIRTVLLTAVEWTSSPVDARVLGVSAAIALAVGVIVGLVPALRASRPDLTAALKTGVREGGVHGTRLRAALTVAQAALSIVLLVGAGLFVRSLANVRALDLGIQPDRVLVVDPRWPRLRGGADTAGVEMARRGDIYIRALERIRRLPGVEHASVAVGLPFMSSFGQSLRVLGWDSIPQLKGGGPNVSAVTSDYFATVGTRLIRGRTFTSSDRKGSEPVAVVSETMAKTLWPARGPIGDCLFSGQDGRTVQTCARIVGIVADARHDELREEPSMHYYLPFGQETQIGGPLLLVRPSDDPSALVPLIRNLVSQLDPSIIYVEENMLQQEIDPQIRPWRLGANMFGLMGVLALVVAAVGLYSVMSYLVAQRTHEFGVRIALGARGWNIFALILRSSVGMAALGVAIRIGLSLWAGRFIAPLLFETSPRDPVVLGGVGAALLAVAVLAGLLPAIRAKRVDPMEALRSE